MKSVMMRIKKYFFLLPGLLFLSVQFNALSAQDSVKHKIAVFAPLFLDSAFNEHGEFRYGKQMPRFMQQGIEFYEGVQLALDSLAAEGNEMEVFVYDTRSLKQGI